VTGGAEFCQDDDTACSQTKDADRIEAELKPKVTLKPLKIDEDEDDEEERIDDPELLGDGGSPASPPSYHSPEGDDESPKSPMGYTSPVPKLSREQQTEFDRVDVLRKSDDTGKTDACCVFFDFDQTLSIIHLWHATGGSTNTKFLDGDISEAHPSLHGTIQPWSDPSAFATHVFSGAPRLALLAHHFASFRKAQCQLGVISFGRLNMIQAALAKVDLLQYFVSYMMHGENGLTKSNTIVLHFGEKGYPDCDPRATYFVDDDVNQVRDVASVIGDDNAIPVLPRAGILRGHLLDLCKAMVSNGQKPDSCLELLEEEAEAARQEEAHRKAAVEELSSSLSGSGFSGSGSQEEEDDDEDTFNMQDFAKLVKSDKDGDF
jgi:hypothetical protein